MKVAVLGAGMADVTLTYELAKAGHDRTSLEKPCQARP